MPNAPQGACDLLDAVFVKDAFVLYLVQRTVDSQDSKSERLIELYRLLDGDVAPLTGLTAPTRAEAQDSLRNRAGYNGVYACVPMHAPTPPTVLV